MSNWIMRWVASGIALAIVSKLNIGVHISDTGSLVTATLVIGLVNSLIRPILSLLTMPLNCLTFGIFGGLLNAALFASTQFIVPGFHVESFFGACLGVVLMGLFSSILSGLLPDNRKK